MLVGSVQDDLNPAVLCVFRIARIILSLLCIRPLDYDIIPIARRSDANCFIHVLLTGMSFYPLKQKPTQLLQLSVHPSVWASNTRRGSGGIHAI